MRSINTEDSMDKRKNWKLEFAALVVTIIMHEHPEYSEAAVTTEVMCYMDESKSTYQILQRFNSQGIISRTARMT